MAKKDARKIAENLGRATGYTFTNHDLAAEALTHPSLSAEASTDNQRLEFLGDRVLGVVIAEALLTRFPDAKEGDMAPRFNALVRRETCAEVAAELGLGELLRMGRSEAMGGGRRKTAILGDAMEAVIAAIYLDGGLAPAAALIINSWADRIEAAETTAPDAKTALQEWAQGQGLKPPQYETVSRTGPDHDPVFTIRASLKGWDPAEASASSKRGAQQAAAAKLLEVIGVAADG